MIDHWFLLHFWLFLKHLKRLWWIIDFFTHVIFHTRNIELHNSDCSWLQFNWIFRRDNIFIRSWNFIYPIPAILWSNKSRAAATLTIEQMRGKVKNVHNSKQHKYQTWSNDNEHVKQNEMSHLKNMMQDRSFCCWFNASQFPMCMLQSMKMCMTSSLINIQ